MKRLSILLTLALCAGPAFAQGSGDPYEDMATKLCTQATKKLTEKKIAVLSFDYVDGRSSTGGRVVSEKLTNRFVELGEFTVIERGMVEKVMRELEFQNAGTVDPETAKKLGKGLGVEAIVTGSLQDMSYGNVEINARVIKTQTYEIIAAATQKVKKTWSDGPPPAAASAPSAVETPAAAPAPFRSSGPRGPNHGFLDLMLGASNGNMSYTRTTYGITGSANLVMGSSPFFGMRVGGFSDFIGGDFEFGAFNHGTLRQTLTINGLTIPGGYLPEDFLHVNTFEMSGDLMLRLPTGEKVVPYFGVGLGLSINNVTSNSNGFWLTSYPGTTRLNQTVPGFLFRVPFGVRFHVADPLDLFVEGRFWMNTFSFNQGFANINNTVTQQGFQFLGGVGLSF
jgi:TolB-like protein